MRIQKLILLVGEALAALAFGVGTLCAPLVQAAMPAIDQPVEGLW